MMPTAAISRLVSLCILALACWRTPVAAQTWTADNGNGTFSNPLFFDEFSDPDLIRVGRDFYLTGTTMHSMPGLPILHSRDLVNWRFLGYAFDRLDLGPEFRLEQGRQAYGQGIWAPCFRFHNGTFYIFSNVNGHTTQVFRATNPAGPWTRTAMKRSLHDLSVVFDDDAKAYAVWGYRGIRLAELTPDLLDVVPGTEREIIAPSAGMGEGLHLYKIGAKYFLTSAWFMGEMRLPTARADRLTGPWEVNQEVSRGEDFGFAEGYRLEAPAQGAAVPTFRVRRGNPESRGRNAIHQGGIVDTPTGEWWGFSMMDANSVGRLTALSPVTWKDGWPYFGLPNNPGRSPRIWVKPRTGITGTPSAPYERSDDFSASRLRPVWQWNHVPVDGDWSLAERPGYLRLHALPASDLLRARNTLTQRSVGPRSTPTVVMDASGLRPGDIAGFALFNRPYAWLGVAVDKDGPALIYFTEERGATTRVPLRTTRVWLRAACDFLQEEAQFSYSTDGLTFHQIGEPFRMLFQLMTFQGVRYSLFAFNLRDGGGHADFDAVDVHEPTPRGLTKAIPYGKRIELVTHGPEARRVSATRDALRAGDGQGTGFEVVDMDLGRVALRTDRGVVSVASDGRLSIHDVAPGEAETFQWIETFTGELVLLSLASHRYVRLDSQTGVLAADGRGPHPNGRDGVRWEWRIADAVAGESIAGRQESNPENVVQHPEAVSFDGPARMPGASPARPVEDAPFTGVGNMGHRCRDWSTLASVVLAVVSLGNTVTAQTSPDWTEPFPPFRIAGNLYYVGSKGLASYLIATPEGHILINSALEANVPLIRSSVERLGLKFADIRILLISHGHWDHNAGSAAIKGLTGAAYMVMDGDVSVVESGGKTDFQYGDVRTSLYPPAKVDRVLYDGDEVKLGGAVLVAHQTPGHTKGCTTWTMTVEEAGHAYRVVIVGSPNVNPGYRLVDNLRYPQIATDYERTFRILRALPCDIFLGAHGSYFDLERKYARLKASDRAPFVDAAGYRAYVADRERAFRAELAKQRGHARGR